jgi:hypothetical protein
MLRRPRLSYANVTSTLALFLAVGGVSWAAATLPKNSVGAKQIKRGAVASAEVKNRSLKPADFALGALPAGPKGDKGDKGDPGAPGLDGSARAHVEVRNTSPPTIVNGTNKNVVSVQRASAAGLYCVALAFDDPKVVVASSDFVGVNVAGTADPQLLAALIPGQCPVGTDVAVGTAQITGGGTTADWENFTMLVQ